MTTTGLTLHSFDDTPEIGPLRPRDEVLADVMRRGRNIRRRRRVLVGVPPVGVLTALAIAIASLGSPVAERVVTTPIGPTPTTSAPASGRTGTATDDGTGRSDARLAPPATGTPRAAARQATPPSSTSSPGTTATTQPPYKFAPCVAAGAPNPHDRRTCYEPGMKSPKGNYVSTDLDARGCVVHNVGEHTAVREDFFCEYDAIRPGGYVADGPFNLLRIVRNGVTIDIDGMDPKTPRCAATGFIRPGDHVYVDGRNYFERSITVSNPNGYTTMSVGDAFHC
jgi:hypothetical protein